MASLNGPQIIAQFNNYTDNADELGDDDLYVLMNKIYHQVLDERPWEFLKKEHSTTASTTVDYLSLPDDFKMISSNDNHYGQPRSVVFVYKSGGITNNTPEEYVVVPFSKRRNYKDLTGYAYYDHRQQRLVFTKQPDGAWAVEFDYIYIPDDITSSTSPTFDGRFHQIIVHGMALDHDIIEANEKALNYQDENNREYHKILNRMEMEDAHQQLNI